MLEEVIGVASSGGLGAIIGAVSGYFTRRQQAKLEESRFEHDQAMRKLDLQEAKLEQEHALAVADKQLELAETEAEIQAQVADSQLLESSILAASKSSGNSKVDALKGLMRPLITVFMLIVSTWLLAALWKKLGGLEAFSTEELVSLFEYMVKQIVFLTVTAVTWWFASRPARLDKK